MKVTKEGFAILENDTHVCKWIKEEGRLDHDQNMLPLVLKHIYRGDTVVDVGAYVGDHTIAYSEKVGTKGRVIAFEPNPDAFECLKYNMRNCENVEIRNEAAGETKEGKVILIKHPENIGMTYVENSKEGLRSVSIDSLHLDECHFIKIDVEGFEMNVLKGAEKTIKKFHPVMLIEINNFALERNGVTNKDIFEYLDTLGYTYGNIYSEQGINEPQLDLLCI
jgi:FkbM family methyltransferase